MSEPDLQIIKIWVEKADHDLGSAEIVYAHIPEYYDTIAFHCQQAVEKYLKAVLIYFGIEFQRSHDLAYLLDLLSTNIQISSQVYDKAIVLNGFSVEIRYPNQIIYLSKEELLQAISIANEFKEMCLAILGL